MPKHKQLNLTIALTQNQIRAVYRPIVDISANAIIGYEVLPFLPHYQLTPETLLFEANNLNLEYKIFLRLLSIGLHQLLQWQLEGLVNRDFYVSFNLTAAQLKGALVKDVLKAINLSGVSTSQVFLEVSRHNNLFPRQTQIIKELSNHSIRISLDHVRVFNRFALDLPGLLIHEIKLHESVVADLERGVEVFRQFEFALPTLRDWNVSIVAQGVTTWYQIEILRSLDVNLYQGGYFSLINLLSEQATAFLTQQQTGLTPWLPIIKSLSS